MFYLALKGGTVVDPSTGSTDGATSRCRRASSPRIAPDIPTAEASRTVEVAGKIVTPGLIDLHAHVFEGFTRTGVRARPRRRGTLA